MELIIKIEVPDKVQAYKITSRISYENEVKSASLDGEEYTFNESNPKTSVKKFLADDFGK